MRFRTKEHYENLFADYPDVVTLQQFKRMLGGIGESTARKLLRENKIFHYYIRQTYYIPKSSVIEYVMSPEYAVYSRKLSARV